MLDKLKQSLLSCANSVGDNLSFAKDKLKALAKKFDELIQSIKKKIDDLKIRFRPKKFKWKSPKILSAVVQKALRENKVVDQIKCDMLNNQYRFTADEGRIGGYLDSAGNYYIGEGHHRMNAALEVFEETGDASYVNQLLANGLWTPGKPRNSGPLPRR